MTQTNVKSVLFPVFASYPNILSFGTSTKSKRAVDGKKILIVLDGTGSMTNMINEDNECTKSVMAKKLVRNIMAAYPTIEVDIMVFNTEPSPLCKIDDVPEPSGSTYFTPLVPAVTELLTKSSVYASVYASVIFMSDGLPTEDHTIARKALETLGNIARESGANPVAVAIGSDADGAACGLFAGNRGYNCFIKYNKDLESVSADIVNGIVCNYEVLENGEYVPVESDNNFYYVTHQASTETVRPDKKLVEKFLNLTVIKNMNDMKQVYLLNSFVNHIVKVLDDVKEQEELIKEFGSRLKIISNNFDSAGHTPGIMSQNAAAYRQSSGGQV
jgi:hypothetical protein